jgi:hypothetical protein
MSSAKTSGSRFGEVAGEVAAGRVNLRAFRTVREGLRRLRRMPDTGIFNGCSLDSADRS